MQSHQIDRYTQLLHFIASHFKEEIKAQDIEAVSHYSYRNINRIFQALQGETIGRHIQRLRIEKAAEYLSYTQRSISDIAYELGFNDLATFSKAFKKRFQTSPSAFRAQNHIQFSPNPPSHKPLDQQSPLAFELVELPQFSYTFMEHKGDYQDIAAVNKTWDSLLALSKRKGMLHEGSLFFGAILDDNEITEAIYCRYRAALVLDPRSSQDFGPIAIHRAQRYAKFIHQGSDVAMPSTYQSIYAQWLTHVQREIADAPVLEFYVQPAPSPLAEGLTEIYVPIV